MGTREGKSGVPLCEILNTPLREAETVLGLFVKIARSNSQIYFSYSH